MLLTTDYATQEPTRSEVDLLKGPTLLEFGSPWCGYCNRVEPLVVEALAKHLGVRPGSPTQAGVVGPFLSCQTLANSDIFQGW